MKTPACRFSSVFLLICSYIPFKVRIYISLIICYPNLHWAAQQYLHWCIHIFTPFLALCTYTSVALIYSRLYFAFVNFFFHFLNQYFLVRPVIAYIIIIIRIIYFAISAFLSFRIILYNICMFVKYIWK